MINLKLLNHIRLNLFLKKKIDHFIKKFNNEIIKVLPSLFSYVNVLYICDMHREMNKNEVWASRWLTQYITFTLSVKVLSSSNKW